MIEAEYREEHWVEVNPEKSQHLEAFQNGDDTVKEETWVSGILEKIEVMQDYDMNTVVDGHTTVGGKAYPNYVNKTAPYEQAHAYFWKDMGNHYVFVLASLNDIRIPKKAMHAKMRDNAAI